MENPLVTEPIPRLVRRIAVPASIGFFFNTMFNVVDTYFAGLISTEALAALSLSLPVFFILLAVGSGISTGTTALIANSLGAGRRKEARLLALQGISYGFLVSIVLSVFGLLCSPFLFRVLGASQGYLAMVSTYMDTLFFGSVFFVTLYMLSGLLNSLGETKPFRNFLIAGFLLNILLDPWFLYGGLGVPAMGLMGIALSTVLIQAGGCLYLAFKVKATGLLAGGESKMAFPRMVPFLEISRQGLPACVNMLTVGMGIFVITYFVSRFGKDAVAAYGTAMRVEQMVLVTTIGLNVATLTLVAQNHGAGLYRRIRETIRTSLLYGGLLMLAGSILVFFLAGPLMSLFSADRRVVETGAVYLRIDALVLYAYVILFVYVSALQGMKRPLYAMLIGLWRQIVAPLLLFWLLTEAMGFGILGIWWGIFGITWSAALFTLFYASLVLKKMDRPSHGHSDH
ncbi:MAG: MATE family efflux transporter [Thermodesulfobacteriota bacterium]